MDELTIGLESCTISTSEDIPAQIQSEDASAQIQSEVKSEIIIPTQLISIQDTWHKWSENSKGICFKSTTKSIGNGEKKLAKELGISNPKGQNSTVDLEHKELGNISVKDMTNDDCILGVEGCQSMHTIFRQILCPMQTWCGKYAPDCKYVSGIKLRMERAYGTSKITIWEGIERHELSASNLLELSNIIECIKRRITKCPGEISSKSEYILDMYNHVTNSTLLELLNGCVRKEAINNTLVIVHKEKGWQIIKNIEKITCTRITRGAPRIHVEFL
jgi:hypothetical protein